MIRAHVGNDILNFSGLLVILATLDALCWIMSVMVLHMVSILTSSCSVPNQFLNSSWNSIFFDPICVASILGGLLIISVFPFHLCVHSDVARNCSVVTSNVDLIADCYICDNIWFVC